MRGRWPQTDSSCRAVILIHVDKQLEWEFAARGGKKGPYPWGKVNATYATKNMNTWQVSRSDSQALGVAGRSLAWVGTTATSQSLGSAPCCPLTSWVSPPTAMYPCRSPPLFLASPTRPRPRTHTRFPCRALLAQGKFPKVNTEEDGFAGPCPVDHYPPNSYGIFNAAGNVWEWVAGGKKDARILRGGSFVDSVDGSFNHAATVREAWGKREGSAGTCASELVVHF